MAPLLLFTLTIAAYAAAPVRLPPAIIGKTYSAGPLVPASGQACPPYGVTMQLAGGMLPPGVELSPAGYFSGEPADPGTYHFVVRSVSNCGSAEQKFVMDVSGAPILNVFPASVDMEVQPGRAPEPVFVRVSSNQASLAYTMEASRGSEWMDARQRLGRTPPAGAALTGDIIEVRVDPARLTPGTHRGFLKVSAWRSANAPLIPVTVTVPGPPAPAHPAPAAHAAPAHAAPVAHAPDPHAAHAPDPHAAPAAAHGHDAHPAPQLPKATPPKPAAKTAAPHGPAPVRKFAASRPRITKPVPLAAKAAPPDAHAAPKPDAHAAPKADAHGAPKPDAHAKKDDGHGAKPDAHAKKDDKGHGAKPDAHAKKDDKGHGAKPDAHAKKDDGHGAKPDAHAKKDDKGHAQTASAHGAKPDAHAPAKH